jgi:hypothetical protein
MKKRHKKILARSERLFKRMMGAPGAGNVVSLWGSHDVELYLEQAKWSPVARLTYSLCLAYRNCRYFEQWLAKPAMTELARCIWADEDRALDDLAKAKVLSASSALWDAQECGDPEEIALALAELRLVVATVVPPRSVR